ncbi:MAG: proprotein convertase P-domain-containing protein [Planctomycetota bacterium]|nr:MAG: proprotein convertase P-domain-containing protein [Planctomycetota bacterium]
MDIRSSTIIVCTVLAIVICFPSFVLSVPFDIYGGDCDLAIVDKPGPGCEMTEAVIDVPDNFTVYDIDVRINITHTNVFDLQLFLQSPSGTRICLNYFDSLSEYDIYPNYTNTIFDDEAMVSIEDGAAPFSGRFRPRGPGQLKDFDGQDTFGLWRLQIYDMFDWDYGTLDSFELLVTIPEPATILLLTLGAGLIGVFRHRRR